MARRIPTGCAHLLPYVISNSRGPVRYETVYPCPARTSKAATRRGAPKRYLQFGGCSTLPGLFELEMANNLIRAGLFFLPAFVGNSALTGLAELWGNGPRPAFARKARQLDLGFENLGLTGLLGVIKGI